MVRLGGTETFPGVVLGAAVAMSPVLTVLYWLATADVMWLVWLVWTDRAFEVR
jgi:hypothetical protein